MQRRQFLQTIGLGTALLAAFGLKEVPVLAEDGGLYYKGFRLHWTGFKEGQTNDLLIGQWVAFPPNRGEMCYAACTTGWSDSFRSGVYFDISPRDGVPIVRCGASEELKNKVKAMTYQNLLAILDKL